MFSKQKMFIAALITKLNLEDEFFERLDENQQQLIDCMILEAIYRLEMAGNNEYLEEITLAWLASVYGRDAGGFLAHFWSVVDKKDVDKLCRMYIEL